MHRSKTKHDIPNDQRLSLYHDCTKQGVTSQVLTCDPDVADTIETMNNRMDFERRVDNLSRLLESCAILGAINMSNIDHLCTILCRIERG
jgi:hypothetical protein